MHMLWLAKLILVGREPFTVNDKHEQQNHKDFVINTKVLGKRYMQVGSYYIRSILFD